MKLSKRERVLLLLLALVAIVALGFRFGIAPQKTRLTDQQAQLADLDAQYIALVSKASTLEDTRQQLADAKENAAQIAARFPDVQNAEAMDAMLHSWLTQCDLSTQFLNAAPLTVTQLAGYSPVPDLINYPAKDSPGQTESAQVLDLVSDAFPCVQYTINFTGTYDNILKFVDIIEQQGTGYHVDSLSFSAYDETSAAQVLPAETPAPDATPAAETAAPEQTAAPDATVPEATPAPESASDASSLSIAQPDKKIQGSLLLTIYMVDKPNFDAPAQADEASDTP